MAFQTNVFRDGEWVTETLDLQAVLRANSSPASKPQRQYAMPAPECGVLTRTIIESPVTNWILPVRLRSAQHMDVAFIGDHYIQISELGQDGQLRDIIRKTDFGSRIRNAKVIGSPPDSTRDEHEEVSVKGQDEHAFFHDNIDISMDDGPPPAPSNITNSSRRLPPQLLMIVLESGDCVFLFVRQGQAGEFEFVDARLRLPNRRIVQPGFHAAVDPSSRYMALACPEDLFVVFELESPRVLNQCYAQNKPLQPVKVCRPRAVNGIIHKMEFLYPRPDDDYHIILLLIVVHEGKSKMITYEWEAGDDLRVVLGEEKRGQPLPPQDQVPLLIIPLTVHSAFFAISARRIAVCRDALSLPAEFNDFVIDVPETSRFHYGPGEPLWAAWTRPYRLPTFRTTRDNIYLAREDGVVLFLEIDSDNILGASVHIGEFNCNIGTSFCSLLDDFNDILIMGGDSGPGTICQIRPRQPNIPLGTIPNWSPVVDIVTSDEWSNSNNPIGERGNKMIPWRERTLGTFNKPDRVFATSGCGVRGAVTEFRYGYRANIGLDMDYEMLAKQCWIFPAGNGSDDPEFHLLISLVDRTVLVCLSGDLEEATEPEAETTLYDLTSRTVTLAQLSEDAVVQVTEKCIVFVSPAQSVRQCHADIFDDPEVTVEDASVLDDLIAVSTHAGMTVRLHLLKLDSSGSVSILRSFDELGEVTCLHLAAVRGVPYIAAGLLRDGEPYLLLCNADKDLIHTPYFVDINSLEVAGLRRVQRNNASPPVLLEPLTSVLLLQEEKSNWTSVVFGTRGGDVAAVTLGSDGRIAAASSEKLGLAATHLSLIQETSLKGSVMALCDGQITLLSQFDTQQAAFRSIHLVWLEDASDTSQQSPAVNSVSLLPKILPGRQSKTQLVLTVASGVSNSRILLAELHAHPRPVHRSIPVGGTPLKVVYSHILNCLVIALKTLDEKSALKFLDPDTGRDLSSPTDKNGNAVEYVSGLGKTGDQILGLSEWRYERQGDKWLFLLVSTKGGRLLVLSTMPYNKGPDGRFDKIQYWTRHKRAMATEPIYSVVGWETNVFFCIGSTLYWEQLDVEERRLKMRATFELASFATSLRVVNGRVIALTDRDSVEIVRITGDTLEEESPSEMTLHHADTTSRCTSHMIEMGDTTAYGVWPDLLVSDRGCCVAGLFVPWQQPGKDCEVMFEAELPASVRKLVRGRTRPGWQQARRDVRYGLQPSTMDGAELLGVCIDGSLQHFTLLSPAIWRVLRLVQNLAFTSATLYPFLYEEAGSDFDEEPQADKSYGMQIDGDMLQRCLNKRGLEELFAHPAHVRRLFSYLDQLDKGQWTAKIRERFDEAAPAPDDMDVDAGVDAAEAESSEMSAEVQQRFEERKKCYLSLLYDIMEYYLAPVL